MSSRKNTNEKFFEISTRIKSVRKKLGLKQKNFAKKIGFTPSFVTNIETGRQRASAPVILEICLQFSVNGDWLLTGNGEMFNIDENDKLLGTERFFFQEGGKKASNFKGGNKSNNLWVTASKLSELAQISRTASKAAIKKGTWRGHILITREAYGNGGKRREVLLSSLPENIKAVYMQSHDSIE